LTKFQRATWAIADDYPVLGVLPRKRLRASVSTLVTNEIRLRAQDIRPESRTQVAQMTEVILTDASLNIDTFRAVFTSDVGNGLSRTCTSGATIET
jgi:hypothetical protein